MRSLAQDESYKNRFHNLLKCDAVKGKSGILPCYTTILYVHQSCHEYTYAKDKQEKKFYSIDIKHKEDAKIKRKLLKRLPKKSSASEVQSKNSYSTFVVENPGAQAPQSYSRMESNNSTSPLVPWKRFGFHSNHSNRNWWNWNIYYPVLTSLRIIYPCIYIHITSILKMYFKSID